MHGVSEGLSERQSPLEWQMNLIHLLPIDGAYLTILEGVDSLAFSSREDTREGRRGRSTYQLC